MFLKFNNRIFNLDRTGSIMLHKNHISIFGIGSTNNESFEYESDTQASFAYNRLTLAIRNGWQLADMSPNKIRSVYERVTRKRNQPKVELPGIPSDEPVMTCF